MLAAIITPAANPGRSGGPWGQGGSGRKYGGRPRAVSRAVNPVPPAYNSACANVLFLPGAWSRAAVIGRGALAKPASLCGRDPCPCYES